MTATSRAACPEVTRTTSLQPFYHCLPSAYICSNQIMGWGEKAIEIRSVETGHLDGVFMHKRAQRLKFLCERNDKVRQCVCEGAWPCARLAVHTLCWADLRGGVVLLFSSEQPLPQKLSEPPPSFPLGSVAFTPGVW